jgi:Fur family ferric uptake transcriptional regulator
MADDRVTYYNEKLLAHGVRLTPQRMMVLDVLACTPGHITADRVLTAVQARYPYVNKTTVYRTLDLLGELGLVATAAGEAGQEYELVDERHHHLVCKRCGYQAELPDSTLNPLRDLIEHEHGFQPVFDHFTLFGLCAACR